MSSQANCDLMVGIAKTMVAVGSALSIIKAGDWANFLPAPLSSHSKTLLKIVQAPSIVLYREKNVCSNCSNWDSFESEMGSY